MSLLDRLRKSTPDEECDFRERMQREKVPLIDKLVMIGTAFVMLVIPSILVLLLLVFLAFLMFGLL